MSQETLGIVFKFFQVRYSKDFSERLPAVLDGIIGTPPSERLSEIHGTERLLKTKTQFFDGYKSWLFASKRTHGLPMKIKSDGSSESLGLDAEEGLGENAALACDPTGSVVAIQSNRHAMSEGVIAAFINRFRPEATVNFSPILREDAIDRLARASQIRKLHIRLAGVVNFDYLKEYGLSVDDAMSLQRLHQSPTMEVVWSVGRGKDEGLGERLRAALRAFINYKNTPEGQERVKALDANLRLEENGCMVTSPVDFLTDRLCYYADVSLNEHRELDEDALLVAARTALGTHAHALRSYVHTPQDD